MAELSIPNVFVNGAGHYIDAEEMNANFQAISDAMTEGSTATVQFKRVYVNGMRIDGDAYYLYPWGGIVPGGNIVMSVASYSIYSNYYKLSSNGIEAYDYIYIGQRNISGSWQIKKSGNNLQFLRYSGATYVPKASFAA